MRSDGIVCRPVGPCAWIGRMGRCMAVRAVSSEIVGLRRVSTEYWRWNDQSTVYRCS